MFLSLTKIESLPGIFFHYVKIIYERKKYVRKKLLLTLSYGLESCFKRSLVSPLCMFIIARFSENARRYFVQSKQFSFAYNAYFVISYNISVDILFSLWYAEYVGVVIGTASFFAGLSTISPPFVKFHMERYRNYIIIVYLIS